VSLMITDYDLKLISASVRRRTERLISDDARVRERQCANLRDARRGASQRAGRSSRSATLIRATRKCRLCGSRESEACTLGGPA